VLHTFNTFQTKPEDLVKYVGIYASKQIPIKITISNQSSTLIAQATGQSSFTLEATGLNKFAFKKSNIVLEFEPDKNLMILKQGGGEFLFTKE
jgi:D-alanyl-D-alanine carboxypeptidase